MTEVIAAEVATKELNDWLDWRKIMPSQREAYSGSIAILVEALQYGFVTLDENKSFTQKLMFPVGEELKVASLVYKPRINDIMLAPCMKGVSPDDSDGRVVGYLQALTGESKQVLKAMDSQDKRISNAIVVFFIA